ncbi:sulfatase [Aureibaculum sp. A20]|uniref:Sulfatase n=1 Tax=Aureibaculum flavum TaxID=2795986 RepID=A0ABS0WVG6_9FLAO|nr:sulfatase [Aureibaculum flavum]MBJ2175974.1 sulfatase [Aureibaculum flavum]
MNKLNNILKIIFIVTIIISCKTTVKTSHDEEERKPNIVFIVVDDLGYSDVGYMNQKEDIQTPNIDKLAKDGMVFTDAYAAAPVCSPTRASIITGKSPAALKLTCHIPGMGMEKYLKKLNTDKKLKEGFFIDHLLIDKISIADVLKQQGYTTGYIGKWHLGGGGSINTDDGIVNADYLPSNYGFDINIGGNAYGQPASYFSPYKNGNLKDGPDGEYLTDRLGDEAIQFIDKNKSKPFFLNLATYTVHTPLAAPVETLNKYNGNKYFAMIEKLDQNVGKVMQKLKESNLLENTIVIFYSDNGGLWGNLPLIGKKGTLNEGGIRVPMVVNWKGKIEKSSSCNTPITSVDFFPTLLQLVGVSTKDYTELEGQSLLPLLYGKSAFPKRSLYWHFPHHRNEGLSMGAAIRNGKWKYIYQFETQKEFLYNLEDDISEENNLVSKFPQQTKELSQELKQWQQKVKAEMPAINN